MRVPDPKEQEPTVDGERDHPVLRIGGSLTAGFIGFVSLLGALNSKLEGLPLALLSLLGAVGTALAVEGARGLRRSNSHRLLLIPAVALSLVGILVAVLHSSGDTVDPDTSERTPQTSTPSFSDSSLELVDVSVVDPSVESPEQEGGDRLPKLDFKVRNIGDRVAFLKRAEFEILETRTTRFCPMPSAVPVSWTYDVGLPENPDATRNIVTRDLSQSIEADGVDRFQFVLGIAGEGPYGGGSILYQLRVRLFYDAGDAKAVETSELIVEVPYAWEVHGAFSPGISSRPFAECLKNNLENVLFMLSLPGIRSQQMVDAEPKIRENLEALERAMNQPH